MDDASFKAAVQESLALLTVAEKIELLRALRTEQDIEYNSTPVVSSQE